MTALASCLYTQGKYWYSIFMAVRYIAFWFCLGILLLTFPATAQQIISPVNQTSYSQEAVLEKLGRSAVVYLGETHDSDQDHQAELKIVRSLYAKNPRIAIGLEMFQRPYQPALDQYLAGKLTETQLQAATEYQQRWGFNWEYYAPLLRFAKQHHLPLLALNTPTEITQKVARQGLRSLTPAQQRSLLRGSIDINNSAYRQLSFRAYQEHQGHASQGFEFFFQAQVLWDETMAATITDFLHDADKQIIVLAGKGHIHYGYGIPSRVARRMRASKIQRQPFVQSSILLNPPDTSAILGQTAADYFWYNE